MIQRIQTVYLAIAVIMFVFCCSMPLAEFEPQAMGASSTMYSLMLLDGDGSAKSFLPVAVFAVTVMAELVTIAALLGYRNRRAQIKLCSWAIALDLIWIAVFAAVVCTLKGESRVHQSFASSLPLIALVLTWLARRAVKKDEELVRSADRIR